jgi:hypothetical protein
MALGAPMLILRNEKTCNIMLRIQVLMEVDSYHFEGENMIVWSEPCHGVMVELGLSFQVPADCLVCRGKIQEFQLNVRNLLSIAESTSEQPTEKEEVSTEAFSSEQPTKREEVSTAASTSEQVSMPIRRVDR